MSTLKGKKVLLGVTGGIAAYKVAHLVRLLIKSGSQVKVVMTPDSKDFITPLTLSTLSKNPVYYKSYSDSQDQGKYLWNNHIDLAMWADFMLIAPATTNTICKMAQGICDNMLMTCYFCAKCPIYFAPAMDLEMYRHPSLKRNLDKLNSFGNIMIPAEFGELASGLFGEGRMCEPENIISFIEDYHSTSSLLFGKKVLISGGPTYESIDRVRFIGNYSSGKMGFSLAKEAAFLGAKVVLISGPSEQQINHCNVSRVDVVSAEKMYSNMHKHFESSDIVIMSAAVSDYKPRYVAKEKIKKKTDTLTIELEKTRDILESLGKLKTHQYLVGFALESQNEIENAIGKLKRKNLDLIVLNSLNDKGAGFQTDTNKVTIIDKNEKQISFELKMKDQVAVDIFKVILSNESFK